jgi:hypothetical protein
MSEQRARSLVRKNRTRFEKQQCAGMIEKVRDAGRNCPAFVRLESRWPLVVGRRPLPD